jgi:type 1 glutamine amidotransferase
MNHHASILESRFSRIRASFSFIFALLFIMSALTSQAAPKPLKALFLTGGGYHDYLKLAPYLTNSFGERVNISFDVDFTMDRLKDPHFADGYDVVVYDLCFDEADPVALDNALDAIHNGKPAVMIHCAVHAFRKAPKIHEWENGVGMRSKVHDAFGPFHTVKLDAKSPILKSFPDDWQTPGDELYQTIEFIEGSHPLLQAKSPRDGRVHIVCWTHTYGKGRVFATTLGHDMKTAGDPDYIGLLARGLLWSCDKLDKKGNPAKGYGKAK